MYEFFKIAEAATGGVLQYSQENTCVGASLVSLSVNFIKKKLQHRYFPVNMTKFLRRPILKNISERLHLK